MGSSVRCGIYVYISMAVDAVVCWALGATVVFVFSSSGFASCFTLVPLRCAVVSSVSVGPPQTNSRPNLQLGLVPPSARPLSSPLLNADVLLTPALHSGRKMFNFGSKLLLLFLLAFPCGLLSIGHVSAQSDSAEDVAEDADAAVDEEEDEEEVLVEEDQIQASEGEEDESDEGSDKLLSSHADADTTIIFTTGEEFPANEIVRFLVGFTNKGSEAFTVQSLEASFRYPQDFQFYIQNFTALPLNTVVQPQAQASFEYSFIPAQPMAGRPFGLVILLNYLDNEGGVFQTAVYNQTVTITEKEEGLDGETMFMYVFLGGLVALMLFGIYQVLETRTKKRLPVKIEKGTGGLNDVDISWIPQETLNVMNKASPKTSPRKRTKRAAGTDQ